MQPALLWPRRWFRPHSPTVVRPTCRMAAPARLRRGSGQSGGPVPTFPPQGRVKCNAVTRLPGDATGTHVAHACIGNGRDQPADRHHARSPASSTSRRLHQHISSAVMRRRYSAGGSTSLLARKLQPIASASGTMMRCACRASRQCLPRVIAPVDCHQPNGIATRICGGERHHGGRLDYRRLRGGQRDHGGIVILPFRPTVCRVHARLNSKRRLACLALPVTVRERGFSPASRTSRRSGRRHRTHNGAFRQRSRQNYRSKARRWRAELDHCGQCALKPAVLDH